MMEYYITQWIIIVVTILFASRDALSSDQFSNYGSTQKTQKKFHFFGLIIRSLVLLLTSLAGNNIPEMMIVGLTNLFLMWSLFDPVLNLSRKVGTFSWDYLGDESGIDGWLKRVFGDKKAGKIKFGFCIILTISLNVLYCFYES